MIITIKVQEQDDPQFVEVVARELRERMSLKTTPKIDVEYPSGQTIKF